MPELQWMKIPDCALHPKEDAECKRLEADGILSKAEWSDYAMPIVQVMKKENAVGCSYMWGL